MMGGGSTYSCRPVGELPEHLAASCVVVRC